MIFFWVKCLKIIDAIDIRMREIGNKFVLTDYTRAERIVGVVKGLDFVREVFVIGDKPVTGCTQFDELLQDSGDGNFSNLWCILTENLKKILF